MTFNLLGLLSVPCCDNVTLHPLDGRTLTQHFDYCTAQMWMWIGQGQREYQHVV